MTIALTGAVPTITLAHRLRIAREFANLDQAELAERADISRTSVVNYELGYRTPRRLYLRAIAAATGVDLHWLETGEAPSNDEASTDVARPKGLEPLTFWFGADEAFWTLDRSLAVVEMWCQLDVDTESTHARAVK
jgi:transcriptional regulator with XRE-family HTH domain